MQSPDDLDWMLEEAKKNPIKIHYDFDTRFQVWENQILPDRLSLIRQYNGDPEYIFRMTNLLHKDKTRLFNRLQKELDNPISFDLKVNALIYVVNQELQIYQNELKKGD